jgi:circadian clock protein KaiB
MKSRGRKPADPDTNNYVLQLFVAGTSPLSTRSIVNITAFCKKFLDGRYDLEIVDIYQQPGEARDQQIIAAPTLVKSLPLPLRRLVGDFSDRDRVAAGLGVETVAG